MSTYALRGVLPSGGLVQHPLTFTDEPSLDEAKAACAGLVSQMPSDAEWSVVDDRKPEEVRK